MFDKLRVQAGVDEVAKSCTIYVNWSWVIDPTSNTMPSCKLFCCGIPQDELINNFLFREQEILDWFERRVVNFNSPDRENLFRLYYQKPSNFGKCYLNTVAFHSGDAINRQQPLRFSYEAKNMIFLVCVFDENRYETRIVAVNSLNDFKFEITRNKKLFGLFGENNTELKLLEGDERQKVLIVEDGGQTTYSLIPKGCSKYYLSEQLANVNPSKIKIKYLSDLI